MILLVLAFALFASASANAIAQPPMTCDTNDDGRVTIAELVEGVNNALNGPPPKCGFGCDEVCNGSAPGVCPCAGQCVRIFDCTPSSLCNDSESQFDHCFGELTCRAPR